MEMLATLWSVEICFHKWLLRKTLFHIPLIKMLIHIYVEIYMFNSQDFSVICAWIRTNWWERTGASPAAAKKLSA